MAQKHEYTIEEFLTDLASNDNVPIYVQRDAQTFIQEMSERDSRNIKNRMKKAMQNVNSSIPRVKVYMPESTEV